MPPKSNISVCTPTGAVRLPVLVAQLLEISQREQQLLDGLVTAVNTNNQAKVMEHAKALASQRGKPSVIVADPVDSF